MHCGATWRGRDGGAEDRRLSDWESPSLRGRELRWVRGLQADSGPVDGNLVWFKLNWLACSKGHLARGRIHLAFTWRVFVSKRRGKRQKKRKAGVS